jgi:hypothetical protein
VLGTGKLLIKVRKPPFVIDTHRIGSGRISAWVPRLSPWPC